MRLLPKNREHGWTPFIWLAYFTFFFIHPVADHVSRKEWLATGLATPVFLIVYFGVFWWRRPWNQLGIAIIVCLGIGFAPYNFGAAGFFIYACSFIPFAVQTESAAIKWLAVVVAIVGVQTWIFHLPLGFLVPAAGFSVLIGGGNIFFAQRNRAQAKLRLAQDEIEHLAKVAERERIARDLHDVLGHTLSVIILKSELARKLIESDPERARAEIADVEETSRAALAEVRSTIRGYRAHSLQSELKQAKAALLTAGVTVNEEAAEIPLTVAQESVVALVIREAVTNVVRHARAHTCSLRLTPVNGSCRLEIHDDGRGGLQIEGHGLRGMRERVEALGGTLVRETTDGTRLTIQFPLAAGTTG